MGYNYKGGIGGAGNAKLIMGPWTHDIFSKNAGELSYPDNAARDPNSNKIFEAMFAEKLLNLYDYGDYRDFPTATYYVMGDISETNDKWNRWATSDVWPIPYIDQKWYLQSDNTLSTSKPSIATEKSYIFNPADPIDTIGGANLVGNNRGPFDQANLENGRQDILSFDYSVSEQLLITGRIKGDIYITSNCTDTDFTMKLCDIYPDGKVMLIADGIIRMRSREGQHKQVLMDGSGTTVYHAEIDLWSTSYVFNEGHKIHVSISSSNYPRFDLNPNTGGEIEYYRDSNPYYYAENTLILSPIYPSSIIFPIPLNDPTFV